MAVKYSESLGCYVECGVAAGAQIIAMSAGAPNKKIYAYDSFEGIPWPSNKDDQFPGIRYLDDWEQKALPDPGHAALATTGATIVPLNDFVDHIAASGVSLKNLEIRKGWFEETVQDHTEPIAILRLDGDLYNSTFVCLQHLYPQVIKGGIVIIDDYGLKGCRAAVHEYFDLIGEEYLLNHFKLIEDKESCVAWFLKP